MENTNNKSLSSLTIVVNLPDNALPESISRRSATIRETLSSNYPSAVVEIRVRKNVAGCPSVRIFSDPGYYFGKNSDVSSTVARF